MNDIPAFSIFCRYNKINDFCVIEMSVNSFNINYLSPTGLIGFWILFIGLIFTGVLFYFVFFRLNEDEDSYKDKERKKLEIENQKQRIDRQYQKFIKILAFSDLWFSNFKNKKNRIVLSYKWKLRSLANYIQQLEMQIYTLNSEFIT